MLEGGYGKIYFQDNKAIKVFKDFRKDVLSKKVEADECDSFRSPLIELNTIRTFRHPHLVEYLSFTITDFSLQVIMPEYKKTLDKIIPINESLAKPIFWQLFTAVEFLHSYNFLHLDIKATNVLLDEDNNAFLTDYGCGNYSSDIKLLNLGTEICRSPENFLPFLDSENISLIKKRLHLKEIVYHEKTDTFGLGTLLINMLTGKFLLYPKLIDITKLPLNYIEEFILDYDKYLKKYFKQLLIFDSFELIKNMINPNFDLRFTDSLIRSFMKEFSDIKPTGYRIRSEFLPLSDINNLHQMLNYLKEENPKIDVSLLAYDIFYRFLTYDKYLIDTEKSCLYIARLLLDDPSELKDVKKEIRDLSTHIIKTLDALIYTNTPFDYIENLGDIEKIIKETLDGKFPYVKKEIDVSKRNSIMKMYFKDLSLK